LVRQIGFGEGEGVGRPASVFEVVAGVAVAVTFGAMLGLLLTH